MMLAILLATAAATATPSETPKPEKSANDRVCRQQLSTGSRLTGKKICLTRGEWAQYEAENKEVADKIIGRTGDVAPNP